MTTSVAEICRIGRILAAWLVITCIASAQDPRIALFEAYNSARTYDEVKPLVSGLLAQQYAALVARDSRQVQDVLAHQQLASYRSRVVEVDDATSFVILESIQPKLGRDTSAQAYLTTKGPAGTWTLANRLMPDVVITGLWTRQFRPSDFVQPASCVIDGREFPTRSALAIRRGEFIQISLYPFEFTEADLDYWRQMSGLPAPDMAADSHFNHRIPTTCRVVVKISSAGRPSLLNVGFDDHSGAVSRSSLWQLPKPDASHVAYQTDLIELATAGALGAGQGSFRWNVNIKIPVWQQGL